MDEVRKKIGDRWDKYGPSVHRLATRIIAQEMDGRGTFMRFDDAYILKFDGLSKKHASRECKLIGEKLMDLFFSSKDFKETSHTRPSRKKRKPKDKTRSKRWPWSGLRALIAKIVRRQRPESPGGGNIPVFPDAVPTPRPDPEDRASKAPDGPSPPQSETSVEPRRDAPIRQGPTKSPLAAGSTIAARHSGQASSAQVRKNAVPTAGGRNATRKVSTPQHAEARSERSPADPANQGQRPRNGLPAVERERTTSPIDLAAVDQARFLRDVRMIENAMSSATIRQKYDTVEKRNTSVFPPPDLHFVYRPMWNLGSKFLTTYRCVPVCKRAEKVVTGDAVLPSFDRQQHVLTLDVFTVENVIANANAMMERDITPILMAPIHLSTLIDDSSRFVFLDSVKSILEGAHHHLLFEIIDMEETGGQTRAWEVRRYVDPFCRGVLGRMSLRHTNFAFWKQIGLTAIGLDLSEDERPEPAVIDDLEMFAALAHQHRITSYVCGLTSVSLAAAAVAAGYGYIEGSAIKADKAKRALDIVPFDVPDLYMGLLRP